MKRVLLEPSNGTLKKIYKILANGNFGVNWQKPEGFKEDYGKAEMVILLPWDGHEK